MRAGDARTTLLADHPELVRRQAAPAPPAPRPCSDEQAAALSGGRSAPRSQALIAPPPRSASRDGEAGVECPMAGAVVELTAAPGAVVAAGDTLMVVSAMKMETAVTAPCAGVVRRVAPLEVGGAVAAGQIVATIAPSGVAPGRAARPMARTPGRRCSTQVKALQDIAHARFAPGSTDPGVVRQRSRGKLTCRERIDLLLDPGSFREVGSDRRLRQLRRRGPHRRLHPGQPRRRLGPDRRAAGGGLRRRLHLARRPLRRLHRRQERPPRPAVSLEFKCPSIRLLDGSSGGGSVATMVPRQQAAGREPRQGELRRDHRRTAAGRRRRRLVPARPSRLVPCSPSSSATVPVVNVLLGSVVGIGAAKAVLGHFSVMVRDIAQLFVAGPPVVAHAMGYDITKEDLGDWRIHCRNGSVDNLAESEADAVAQTRRFLSYLPSVRLRSPAAARPPTIPPTGARKSSSPSCRASAPPPSTCAAPSA